jgi:hypothetical protein
VNGKKAKQIRSHAKSMLLDWLKTMVSDEEATKIDESNFEDYLPSQGHIYANQKIILSAYSFKWFVNNIKKILKKERSRDVRTIGLDEILNDGRG